MKQVFLFLSLLTILIACNSNTANNTHAAGDSGHTVSGVANSEAISTDTAAIKAQPAGNENKDSVKR